MKPKNCVLNIEHYLNEIRFSFCRHFQQMKTHLFSLFSSNKKHMFDEEMRNYGAEYCN